MTLVIMLGLVLGRNLWYLVGEGYLPGLSHLIPVITGQERVQTLSGETDEVVLDFLFQLAIDAKKDSLKAQAVSICTNEFISGAFESTMYNFFRCYNQITSIFCINAFGEASKELETCILPPPTNT